MWIVVDWPEGDASVTTVPLSYFKMLTSQSSSDYVGHLKERDDDGDLTNEEVVPLSFADDGASAPLRKQLSHTLDKQGQSESFQEKMLQFSKLTVQVLQPPILQPLFFLFEKRL